MSRVDLANHVGHYAVVVLVDGLPLVQCIPCNLIIGGSPDEGLDPAEARAEELRVKFDGQWGEHPRLDRGTWHDDLAAGGTSLGYWEWLVNQEETYDEDLDDLGEAEVEDDDDDTVVDCPACDGNDDNCTTCEGIGHVSQETHDEYHNPSTVTISVPAGPRRCKMCSSVLLLEHDGKVICEVCHFTEPINGPQS